MAGRDRDFLPAAGRFIPVGLYDLAASATVREGRWRGRLADQAARAVAAGGSVTELGAGTGSSTAGLREALGPEATLNAVDPDERALAIARRKLSGKSVNWIVGGAESVPLPDRSQDAVVAALVLHHLRTPEKLAALKEAHRLLRPGGTSLIADFGPPQDPLMWAAFQGLRLIDGRETTAGHLEGVLSRMLPEAGFLPPARIDRLRTAVGTLEVLKAIRPSHGRPQE